MAQPITYSTVIDLIQRGIKSRKAMAQTLNPSDGTRTCIEYCKATNAGERCACRDLMPLFEGLKALGVVKSNTQGFALINPQGPWNIPDANGVSILNPNPTPEAHVLPESIKPLLHINKRFSIMSKLVKLVALGKANSLLITGQGGTGKTGEVLATMAEMGLESRNPGQTVEPGAQFLHVKGKAAPADLYRVLYENPDATIVFDDCDSVLQGDGMNILKSALDTYKTRVVSWQSKYIQTTLGLPESFEFRGSVIFITNLTKIDQALQSRGYVVNLYMTPDDLCDRMDAMGAKMCPHLTEAQHVELIDFIREHKLEFSDLSLRTYIKIAAMMQDADWKDDAVFAN